MRDKTPVGLVTGVAIETLQPNSESAIAVPLPMHSTSGVDQGLRVFSQQSDALQCFHVEIGPVLIISNDPARKMRHSSSEVVCSQRNPNRATTNRGPPPKAGCKGGCSRNHLLDMIDSSSLSDLNVKPLISLEFMFLARKIKLNDINMLSVKRTSSPTGC